MSAARGALTELDDDGLRATVERHGGKPFQARQLAHWIYRHGARDAAECRNLPRALAEAVLAETPVRSTTVRTVQRGADDTEKMLIGLADGDAVEAVLIPEGERNTLCVSSQVGCPVACVFCASGLGGVRRNLSTGEIVEQVLHALDRLRAADRRLTNVVVMGMGEPLLNLDALLPALLRITDPQGVGLGARRITVSTSGYPDRIAKLAACAQQFGLAVSLHAADDRLRKRLVPTAKSPVSALVGAARAYAAANNREVTFEVVLLAGVNDSERDARALVTALRGVRCTVNLIPWNPVDAIPDLRRPSPQRVEAFRAHLERGGLKTTTRRQRGADRDAACGQLRLREAH